MLDTDIDPSSLKRIRAKLAIVQEDASAIDALSHSERIAVALILNRLEFIEGHDTVLGAIDRLGPDDLLVSIHLHRERNRMRS